jgi:uracil-DNA glycosylase
LGFDIRLRVRDQVGSECQIHSTSRALEEAGIDRNKVYVTNAVKHFKFVPRGKIRLHQKPATPEIKACRQWYERELAAIKPELVVAMGATAAQSGLGKITPINKNRGRVINLDYGMKALVTAHPSYLLRLPDADSRALEYGRFVDDLKIAAALLRTSAHAANCAKPTGAAASNLPPLSSNC